MSETDISITIARVFNCLQDKACRKNYKRIRENKREYQKAVVLSHTCKKCDGNLRPIKGKNDLMFSPGSLQCRNCGRINILK